MRILLSALSFRSEFGGPARSVPQLGASLANLGWEVGLWAPDGTATSSDLVKNIDCVTGLRGSVDEAWVEFGPIDIVHDNGLWQPHHRSLARLAREYKVPRVISTRGMLEPWALQHKRRKKKAAWWLYQKRDLLGANALHATAPSEAEHLKKLGLTNQIQIIPNGVHIPPIESESRTKSLFAETKTCLFLSRIHPKKGLPILIQAWSEVRPLNWKLVIAGPDESNHKAELEALVNQLNLHDEISFVGTLEGEDKRMALSSSDLFVLPTYSENFGIVVAEALAHGCPVITTHGAPWRQIEISKCGWWVPTTIPSVKQALLEAVSLTAEERKIMGQRGRKFVEQAFAWPNIAAQFSDLYERICYQKT